MTMLLWSFQLFLPPSLFSLAAMPSEGGVRFPLSENMFFIGSGAFPISHNLQDPEKIPGFLPEVAHVVQNFLFGILECAQCTADVMFLV